MSWKWLIVLSCMPRTQLISRYGNRATALTARNFYMTKNEEVTTLWSAYSREGMTRMDANECLMKYHGQL